MEFKEKILLLHSSLQKSIRWGEINAARYFAKEIVKEGQPGAVLNRLTIMAAEDVGLADPTLVRYIGQRNKDFEHWEEVTFPH